MNSDLLTVVAEVFAKPGKEDEVYKHLLGFVEPTRKEEGCLQYDLHVANDQPGHFIFYETWTSEQHLEKHSASAHIQAFRAIAPTLTTGPTRIVKATRIA